MRVFQSIDEFLNITYDYVDKHGPFTEESYEKWLDTQEKWIGIGWNGSRNVQKSDR